MASTVSRLHVAYRADLERRTRAATARVLAADPTDLDGWLADVVPIVLDAQRVAVSVTDAFLSLDAGVATSTSTAPWGLDPDPIIGAAARNGTPLEDVYARNLRAAAGTARQRLTREVATDITLARRRASHLHVVGDPRITGWRRVTGPRACGLCVVAATRVYRTQELQPIHSHCSCTVQPVYGPGDAPEVTSEFLEDLYERAGSTTYADLRTIRLDADEIPPGLTADGLPERVAIRVTPELGPTLVAA